MKFWLIKGEGEQARRYKVVSINKKVGTVKLVGEHRNFETVLQKALEQGYKLIKEQ